MKSIAPTAPPPRFARCLRAAVLAACLAASAAAQALTPSEFFAKVSPSVWLVLTYDQAGLPLKSGSAVVIAPHTLITNCHVLKGVHSFQLQNEGRRYIGRLELWDTPRDLCQVKAAMDARAVELGDSSRVVVGQPVYALGAPLGYELTLSNGLVSALRQDDTRQLAKIQTSAPISHGSSGGGLFDTDGRLIGITSSGVDDGQNLNFALPVAWVRELPRRHLAAQGKDPRPVAATAATPRDPMPAPLPPPLPVPEPPPAIVAAPGAPAAPAAPAPVAAAPAGLPRIPFLSAVRQAEYWDHVNNAASPKACAISDNGHWACAEGNRPRDRSLPWDPKVRALNRCAEFAGKPCMLFQVDDKIVYQAPAATSTAP
jgi:S1-C subfamily serine protease